MTPKTPVFVYNPHTIEKPMPVHIFPSLVEAREWMKDKKDFLLGWEIKLHVYGDLGDY